MGDKYTFKNQDSYNSLFSNAAAEEGDSTVGLQWELSLFCNHYETKQHNNKGMDNPQGDGDQLAAYVKNGGYFWNSYTKGGSVRTPNEEQKAVMDDILINGNRYLPLYVQEQGNLSIVAELASGGSTSDRSNYIPNETRYREKGGDNWLTFYGFPADDLDPFGYSDADYKKWNDS